MWLTGPVAPRHVGSSQTRAQTRVPCTGRQTLNHCTTREARILFILNRRMGVQVVHIQYGLPVQTLLIFFFSNLFIYLLIIYVCIYLWLCWVFVSVRGLSLVAASGGYSLLQCAGFSLRWLLLLWIMGSRRVGFSSCGARASVVVARGLSSCGLWALERRLSSCGTWA